MRPAFLTALVVTLVGVSAARAAPAPAPTLGALFSTTKAIDVVLDQVCLPAVLNDQPVAPLALAAGMLAVPDKTLNLGAQAKVWRIASIDAVYAVAWTDGTCSVFVISPLGDSAAQRSEAARVVSARTEHFSRGAEETQPGKAGATYCTAPPNPVFVRIFGPAPGKRDSETLGVNINRAKAVDLAACHAAP